MIKFKENGGKKMDFNKMKTEELIEFYKKNQEFLKFLEKEQENVNKK